MKTVGLLWSLWKPTTLLKTINHHSALSFMLSDLTLRCHPNFGLLGNASQLLKRAVLPLGRPKFPAELGGSGFCAALWRVPCFHLLLLSGAPGSWSLVSWTFSSWMVSLLHFVFLSKPIPALCSLPNSVQHPSGIGLTLISTHPVSPELFGFLSLPLPRACWVTLGC